MAEFNLTAQRKQRSQDPKTLIMTDDDGAILSKYQLASEMPAEVLDLGVEGKLSAALRQLFLDPQDADEFMSKHKPSVQDLLDIMRGLYGMGEPGESLASGS